MELSAENAAQLWVPVGFLHGFVTLVDETDVTYKCTEYYSADHDRTILWNDPALAIDWGVTEHDAILSDKDQTGLRFSDFSSPFSFPNE